MGDYHILEQFDIDADRATVRRALTGRDAIASWWSTRTELSQGDDPQLKVGFPDAPMPFEFAVHDDGGDRIEWVTGAMPPPWAGTTVRWDLLDRDDGKPGTRLLFSHRDWDADNSSIPIVTPAWAQIILRLKGYAETGTPQPFFDF
jgi:uncharacterized protein YndB with AHSA1/START domain